MDMPFLPNMEKMREQLERATFLGVSSDGLVSVTVTAAQSVVGLEINSALVNPDKKEQLCRSVVEATNNALDNSKQGLVGKLAEFFGNDPSGIIGNMFGQKD